MDGISVKMAGGVLLCIDLAKSHDTCVEGYKDAQGRIVITDCYQINNPTPKGQ